MLFADSSEHGKEKTKQVVLFGRSKLYHKDALGRRDRIYAQTNMKGKNHQTPSYDRWIKNELKKNREQKKSRREKEKKRERKKRERKRKKITHLNNKF